MALNKSITNQLGVTTNYHKIREIEMRKIRRTDLDPETEEAKIVESYSMQVQIFSYVSAEVRQNSESYAADRKQLILSATVEEGDSTPAFELAYNKLKGTSIFEGATDC